MGKLLKTQLSNFLFPLKQQMHSKTLLSASLMLGLVFAPVLAVAGPSNNTINFSTGTVNNLYAGSTNNGNATGNKIKATGGTVTGNSFAGTSNSGNAIGNTFIVDGGTFKRYTFAGQSQSGNAIGNTFFLKNGHVEYIAGGRSHSGLVKGNSVFISNGTVNIAAAARSNGTAHLEGNLIDISGGTIFNYTTGAYVQYGTATNNTVKISGGTFNGDIYGADSKSGTLIGNSVYITGAITPALDGNLIYGATSQTGAVTGNLVDIRGSVDIKNNTVAGAYSGSNSVSGNRVVIAGAALAGAAKIYGGQTLTGSASNNSVYMNTTGTLAGTDVAGGYSTSGNVSGNTVVIDNATFTGASSVSGGHSDTGTVSGNTVTINGGTFAGKVTGGHSKSGTVTGNNLIINGGTFTTGTEITGGSVNTLAGTTSGNTITILDASGINAGAKLSGGSTDTTSRAITSTHNPALRSGNTLVLKDNTKVASVSNFEHYEFHMADSHATAPMLSADNLHLGTDANLRVYLGNKGDNLGVGERINVFKSTGAGVVEGNLGTNVALQGMSVVNHLTYGGVGSGTHYFTITGQSAHPHSVTFPEARLASFAFMNQADDLLVGQGMASAISATTTSPSQWVSFGALSVGKSGYETDSGTTGDVEFGGMSVVTGVSKIMPAGNGSFLTGAYFEAGTGFIDVDNDNRGQSSVNTNGDSNYYGMGLFGRYENNGVYGLGFIRAGVLDTDFETQDNRYQLDYDAKTAYYGAGVSLGYKLELFENRDMLDVYTRYMWTQLAEKDQNLDSQDYTFKAINSHQARIGAQYNFMQNKGFSPFVGIAGQYEFDGESHATIRGNLNTATPDITGFTGIAEIGIRVLPNLKMPVTTSINLEAYLGKREGISTTLDFAYFF